MLLGGEMGGITPTTWIVIRLLQFKTYFPSLCFLVCCCRSKLVTNVAMTTSERDICQRNERFSQIWGEIFFMLAAAVSCWQVVVTGRVTWPDLRTDCDIKYKESHVRSVKSVSIHHSNYRHSHHTLSSLHLVLKLSAGQAQRKTLKCLNTKTE